MDSEKSTTEKSEVKLNKVRFVFIGGDRNGEEVAIRRETFFIGRSASNNLVLDDRSISRKHAVLNFLEGKFILSDLNSFKGTYVNSQKISETELKNWDRVRFGNFVLEFQTGSKRRKKVKKIHLIWPLMFVLGVLISLAVFFFKPTITPIDKELLREVEYNYSEGVKAYNVDKNATAAGEYWKKVLQLDPKGETDEAKKVKVLLKTLSSNKGAAGNR